MQHLHNINVVSQLNPAQVSSATVPVLGTHDGSFHCDEALAISMLAILPEFQQSTVLRTRNTEALNSCSIVVDVGAVYDPSTHRYDHHQREFTGTFSDKHKIKLSSAGLVYKHFGKRILSTFLNLNVAETEAEKLAEIIYVKVYEGFVQHIDGIDNGVEVADGELRYDISTTLSARVGKLNPSWNEEQSSDYSNAQFLKALALTGGEFFSYVEGLAMNWWPARSEVQRAIVSRLLVHPSGHIAVLEQYCPWQSHLFDIEAEIRVEPLILYVLYGDSSGSWRIQAVPEKPGSFQSRRKLPEAWNGLRDDVLSEKTGILGCIFVHATGFIGGHKTREGALAMAIKALE